MEKTLLQKLMSRIPKIDLYPSKHPKKIKLPSYKYIHESTKWIEVKDDQGNMVPRLVGVTYIKEK